VPYRVEVLALAEKQISAIDIWWHENRPAAPLLFHEELASAMSLLAVMPGGGRDYASCPVPDVQRLLLRATRHHVYYRVIQDNVQILAVWSALRGSGPRLDPITPPDPCR